MRSMHLGPVRAIKATGAQPEPFLRCVVARAGSGCHSENACHLPPDFPSLTDVVYFGGSLPPGGSGARIGPVMRRTPR